MTDVTPAPLVEARGVSKRFGATRALNDVSVALGPGQVHALVGENGAGKSTLIKLIGGVYRPDAGTIRIDGGEVALDSPGDALAAGIVVIPQEMRVVPAMTVAENVTLGAAPTRRVAGLLPAVDRGAMRREAEALLARLNLRVDPDLAVDRLGYAERQLVMIARALRRDARVLILDEPTAALEAREVDRLFAVIERLKRDGVAILYVSHRLEEVEALADLCTVMRDGRVVEVLPRGELDHDRLVRLMTGRDLEELHRPHDLEAGEILLHFDPAGADTANSVTLRRRRVLGLAGLLGSGTTALLRAMFGAGPAAATPTLRGNRARIASPADAIRHGLGLVPNERGLGLVMGLTVRENIVLPNLAKLSGIRGLDRARVNRLVDGLMEALDIRPRDPAKPVRELSGGNQQKVIFARWLAGHADILLLDEPTHGIDIGAKVQVHRLMRRFVEDGGAVALASSEMIEVLSLSDELIVMRAGDLVARMTRDGDYTERALRTALGG